MQVATQRCMCMLELWGYFLIFKIFNASQQPACFPASLKALSRHFRKIIHNECSISFLNGSSWFRAAAVCVLLVLFSLVCIALHSLTLGPICHLITQPVPCHPSATSCFQLLADYSEQIGICSRFHHLGCSLFPGGSLVQWVVPIKAGCSSRSGKISLFTAFWTSL